jgi:predicted peptidase
VKKPDRVAASESRTMSDGKIKTRNERGTTMRRITLFLAATGLAALTLFPAMAQSPKDVEQVKSFTAKIKRTVGADYLLFLPKDYDAKKSKRWPLILFLHGAGERGTNVWLVARHGPPKIVRENQDLHFIVVSPQCPTGQRWDNDVVLALLDEAIKKYRVDPSRVYLTGLSMGGYGTWSLGLEHPERFAAIAPICGGGDPLRLLLADPRTINPIKKLPVWAFHGAKDPVVKVEESQRMIEALKKAGVKEVELTIYPEAQHDSWTETYNNPKLYEWFLAHQKK